MKKIKNFIGGEWCEPISGRYLDNVNSALGEVYSQLPDSDELDAAAAVTAASEAFEAWSKTTLEQRAILLQKMADILDRRREEFALAESIDNGKPISLSLQGDIPRAASNLRFYAGGAMHFASESHAMPNFGVNYTLRKPVGPVLSISPWNLPLHIFTWKIAPALAAGNTVVAKPSEITPMTAYLFGEICQEAGLPAGVLNIIHGLGAKAAMPVAKDPRIKAVTFTGGTATGRILAQEIAPTFKKMSLELGGKNANIIFDDCDLDQAVETTLLTSFSNQGQICLCGSRLLIQQGIYPKFKQKLLEAIQKLPVGNPMDPTTRVGAIVSKSHFEKILSYIQIAKDEGGKILSGGEKLSPHGECANGYFIKPTVIEGLDNMARCNQEEIFGPVVTLQSFATKEEAISLANGTPYGLAASIWTQDLKQAHVVADALDSGIIWVNCWMIRDLRTPFGGMKQSGVGREGGWESMRFFTEPKNICIKY